MTYLFQLWSRALVLVALLIPMLLAGQSKQEELSLDSFFVFTAISKQEKASFYRYDPPLLVKRQPLKTTQLALTYPEEVLLAMISATDNSVSVRATAYCRVGDQGRSLPSKGIRDEKIKPPGTDAYLVRSL